MNRTEGWKKNKRFLRVSTLLLPIIVLSLASTSFVAEQHYYIEYLFIVKSEHISMTYYLSLAVSSNGTIILYKTSPITVSDFLYTLKHVKREDFVNHLVGEITDMWLNKTRPLNTFPSKVRRVSYTYLSIKSMIVKAVVVYRMNSVEYRDVKNGILLGGTLRILIDKVVVNNIELVVRENFTVEYLTVDFRPQEMLVGSTVSPLISRDIAETMAYATTAVVLVLLVNTFAKWSEYRVV